MHIFYSEPKHCHSFNNIRDQLVPFFAISRSWLWKRSIIQTLKIHRKFLKIATTIIFSQQWSEKLGNLFKQTKSGKLVALKVSGKFPEINTRIFVPLSPCLCHEHQRLFPRRFLAHQSCPWTVDKYMAVMCWSASYFMYDMVRTDSNKMLSLSKKYVRWNEPLALATLKVFVLFYPRQKIRSTIHRRSLKW